jgi:hypothetical protein
VGQEQRRLIDQEWVGMPEFVQPKVDPFVKFDLILEKSLTSDDAIVQLAELLGQTVTLKTKSLYYPPFVRGVHSGKRYVRAGLPASPPKYPIYIISKGRWHQRLTVRALHEIGIQEYKVVVEAEEYEKYAGVISPDNILVVPKKYFAEYDTCDDLSSEQLGVGPGAARNFCWDHAITTGAKRHWVLDDNCQHFYRLNRNAKVRVTTGVIFGCMEDFVDRYQNVYLAGLNYHGLCKQNDAVPPFILNTRIYSFLLIQNDIPYRWRGRYSEDTDLSLRVLKDGHCTIQFNAFLAEKIMTQRNGGGNTEEFYKKHGTLAKSKMIEKLHPDVAKVVWKFNRWHHQVDYRPFKKNKLIRSPDIDWSHFGKIKEYWMQLSEVDESRSPVDKESLKWKRMV